MKNDGTYFIVLNTHRDTLGLIPTSDPEKWAALPPIIYPFQHAGYEFFVHRPARSWGEVEFRAAGWEVSEKLTGTRILLRSYDFRGLARDAAKKIIDQHIDRLAEEIEKNKITLKGEVNDNKDKESTKTHQTCG